MKRIALVSYYCPPMLGAESILVWKTLRYLSLWHEVIVLTSDDPGSADPAMAAPDAVRVVRLPSHKPTATFPRKVSERLIGKVADEHILWARVSNRELVRTESVDAIYSRSHPGASHILACRLKRRIDKPWIAQFSDPWADNPYHRDHTWLRIRNDRASESNVVREADRLIFPTKEIADMYELHYPTERIAERTVVLPHHFSPELYGDERGHRDAVGGTSIGISASEASSPLQDASNRKWTLNSFGDFYGMRSPEPLIRAIQSVAERDKAAVSACDIGLIGNVASKFHSLLEQSPIAIRRSRLSYLQSLHAMTQSDALLLVDAPSESGVNPFLPSKLIDYLGAGRPILGITDVCGTAADILREQGHTVVSPRDIDGIASALVALLANGAPRHRVAAPPAAYSSEVVVKRLSQLIEEL